MTLKHTPGPRLILDKALGGYRLWLNGTVILTFTAKQIPAIAAAPGLLAALQGIIEHRERALLDTTETPAYAAARAAIAKATGEL